jgi:hypothetical protein
MRAWKFWDWTAYGALAVATFMTALDSALKNSPAVATFLPGPVDSVAWSFAPFVLILVATIILLVRAFLPTSHAWQTVKEETLSLLPPREVPRVRFVSESEFAVLPLHFSVDLTAQIPTVEVRLYVVSFLPRPIQLTNIELSLQVSSMPAIEDITFRQKDLRVDPKEYEVVICRRQLTNAERDMPTWRDGRTSGSSFSLTARATDGEKPFTYGPVSSMVIEGWINKPAKVTP